MNPQKVKVPAIFRLLVNNGGVIPSSYAVIISVSIGVVAISASALNTGESLMAVTLISLGLWRGLYLTVS